ncbi:MAG TPA: alpha/beta hydrolase [Allosphingosinicella sp.]
MAFALSLPGLGGGVSARSTPNAPVLQAAPPAPASQATADGATIGVWKPPPGLTQVPLWPAGAPDMEDVKRAAEYSRTGTNPKRFAGLPVTGVYNVMAPTMTVFPAKAPGKRAAMLVFPGGGFQQLAIDLEGSEACHWLTARRIVCVLIKYRVPGTNHHYDEACDCAVTPKRLLALQDAQRAVRLVRAQAASLHVDPDRIGVLGFSAGGYLVAQTSNILAPAYTPADAVDRISSRPDFAVALYPGHLCRTGRILDPTIQVTKKTPPTFLLQAWDDPTDEICNSVVYARALEAAGVPAEIHLFAKGGHAFGLRPSGHSVDIWPSLLENWLKETGIL